MRDELENTYRLHRQGLFSLAQSITGCRPLAEDAVHSAFERLFRSPKPDGDVVSYVFAAVRNAARDAVRSNRRAAIVRESLFSASVPLESEIDDPADDLLTAERDQILRSAVDELDYDVREVVVLKTFAELTFDAIGEVLNQPAKTVATKYRRALIKLEEELRGQL